MPETKKLTVIELQMKIEQLKAARDRAMAMGHRAIATECRKMISAYCRRIPAARKRELLEDRNA